MEEEIHGGLAKIALLLKSASVQVSNGHLENGLATLNKAAVSLDEWIGALSGAADDARIERR